jgi:hypothetical protein
MLTDQLLGGHAEDALSGLLYAYNTLVLVIKEHGV